MTFLGHLRTTPRRFGRWENALVAACALAALSSCALVSSDVACREDRDCPDPVPHCAATDGGVGSCENRGALYEREEDDGDEDDGGFPLLLDGGPAAALDAGALDASALDASTGGPP